MSENAKKPTLYLIGGPNGSGKTTFATQYLPTEAKCRKFLNSDEIAKGLSPFDSGAAQLQAGRILLDFLKRYIAAGESFALESTLSGRTYVKYLEQAKAAGFKIEAIFSGCLPHKNLTSAFSNGSKREDTTSHGLTCIAATQELWPICSTNICPSPIAGIFGTRKIYHSI